MGCESYETRDDKLRLYGGYADFIHMESEAWVCLRNDAGDCKHFIWGTRPDLCDSHIFCDKQLQREVDARFGGLYCGVDFVGNLL